MTQLYDRILLWHKLVAQQTGGLALCSAKHRLNVTEARGWIAALRNVSDDIAQFLNDGTFILDDKGQRVVQSSVDNDTGEQHVADSTTKPEHHSIPRAVDRKVGGPRVATRKKT